MQVSLLNAESFSYRSWLRARFVKGITIAEGFDENHALLQQRYGLKELRPVRLLYRLATRERWKEKSLARSHAHAIAKLNIHLGTHPSACDSDNVTSHWLLLHQSLHFASCF
jgi:hypothetical protein